MAEEIPDDCWSLVHDAHCHPTDSMGSIEKISEMKTQTLCIMATHSTDQQLVAETVDRFPEKVIASFGLHPWFTHMYYIDSPPESKLAHYNQILQPSPDDKFIDMLPAPISFQEHLEEMRRNLKTYPSAFVGEIGLDRSFRIPHPTEMGRHPNRGALTNFRVDMQHQARILEAQLTLAAELDRSVSIHGVQAHGVLFQTVSSLWKGYERPSKSKRRKQKQQRQHDFGQEDGRENISRTVPYPRRICLHSYSGPVEQIRIWTSDSVPCEVYFSFSTTINERNARWAAVVEAVPASRLLVESDWHEAGKEMEKLEAAAVQALAQMRAWPVRVALQQLATNWARFVGSTRVSQSSSQDLEV